MDETSVNIAFTRLYGYAKVGKRLNEGVLDVRFERESVLSAMKVNGETCPIVFSGTLNKEKFAEYIKNNLKNFLKKDEILLLDNSSVHRSKLVMQTFEECGIQVFFLPPYSPDFNPIELLWTHLKSYLKKVKARTHELLKNAVFTHLNSLKSAFAQHWFSHCGF